MRKYLKPLTWALGLGLLVGFATPTEARTSGTVEDGWMYITTSNDDEELWVNVEEAYRVVRTPIYQRTLWFKYEPILGTGYTMVRVSFRCVSQEFSVLESIKYSEQGKVIGSKKPGYAPWHSIVPDSQGTLMHAVACFVPKD